MNIDCRFTGQDWERLERDWTAWWQGELDRPMVMVETVITMYAGKQTFTREFMLDKPVDQVLDHYQRLLEEGDYHGDAWPKLFVNHGPGLAAGFLGAEVIGRPEEHTVWFETKERVPIEELRLVFDPENPWWKRTKAIVGRAVERFGDRVAVAHTDLGGNLDILAPFRTANQLLLDLYDHPDQIARLTREITEAWLRYYRELCDLVGPAGRGTCNWAAVWSPRRTYMTQSDFSYMISPQMFERFVLPDLEACFRSLDHACYHLDGQGQLRHLDLLLSIKNLSCVQWIPGEGKPPPEQWLPLLKRIIDSGRRCQLYVTAEGARRIVKELGGKGFAFYLLERMNADEVADFQKLLAEEDLRGG